MNSNPPINNIYLKFFDKETSNAPYVMNRTSKDLRSTRREESLVSKNARSKGNMILH